MLPRIKIPSIICQVHTASEKTLDSICTQCVDLGLLCSQCCSDKHSNHDTMTIDEISDKVAIQGFEKAINQQSALGVGLNTIRARCLKGIAEVREQIIEHLNQLQHRVEDWFTKQKKSIDAFKSNLKVPAFFNISHINDVMTVNQQLIKLAKELNSLSSAKEVLTSKVAERLGSIRDSEKDVLSLLIAAANLCKSKFDEWKPKEVNLFANEHVVETELVTVKDSERMVLASSLSTTLRHNDVTVSGNIATRTLQTGSLAACAMGELPLLLGLKDKQYHYRLRIAKFVGGIIIGVGRTETIKEKRFELGGHFVGVACEGRLFSSSDSEAHRMKSAVTFRNDGDIVELMVDSGTGILQVSCKGNSQSLKLDTLVEKDDPYRLAVYLFQEGQSVEILSEK